MVASSSRSAHTQQHQATKQSTAPNNSDSVKSKKRKAKGKGKEKDISNVGPDERGFEGTNLREEADVLCQDDFPWDWHSLTDSNSSTVPPIFTKDGSYFFSIVGSSIKIHSTSTGQVVSTLYAPQPRSSASNTITCAILNPSNAFQLITGSLNGYISVWDFLDGVVLQTIDVGQPIYHLCAHEKFANSVFIAAGKSISKQSSGDSIVLKVSLIPTEETANADIQKSSETLAIGKTKQIAGLSFSPSGSWLIAIAAHKAYVALTSSLKSGFTKFVSPDRLTCLAIPPTEEYFATGDENGHVRLWYCLNDEAVTKKPVGVQKKARTTTLHWHAHAVSSLAFTANGAYLLSGGEEAVLVIWQLHTGKKEFVPRVGAPIASIALSRSHNHEEYLLGLVDSTYLFIDSSTLKISGSYSRVKLDPTSTPHSSLQSYAPLAYHSLTSTLILPSSHPSSLQIYDPSSSKILSELEVSPSSRVSRRDDQPIEPPRVEKVSISPSGEWMATIDRREGDETFRGEVHLKFWWWDRKAGFWILNTRIDGPHGLEPITTATFNPAAQDRRSLVFATTGADGCVKTWKVRSVKDKTEDYWILRSSLNFQSEVPTHAAFSPCGSVLAVSLGSYVALYDAVTNILCQKLSFAECKSIRSVHFFGKGRYLAVVGLRDLIIWDLVLQAAQWHRHSKLDITHVVSHTTADTFAAFSSSPSTSPSQSRICLYHATSSSPSKTNSLPFILRNTVPYRQNATSSNNSFSLVGITQSWGVVLCGDDVKPTTQDAAAPLPRSPEQGPSLFQDIFGKSAFVEPSTSTPTSHVQPWSGREASTVFSGPAYLMPPMGTLFAPLIDGFLKVRPEPSDLPPASEDDDVEMEDAADDDQRRSSATQHTSRVDQDELDTLVSLFRLHSVNPPSRPPPSPRVKENGISSGAQQVNGISHQPVAPKPNGIMIEKTKALAPNPPPSSPSSSEASEAPPPVTGNLKKRKKAH